MNAIFMYSYSNLNGCLEFKPQVVEPSSCGISQNNDHLRLLAAKQKGIEEEKVIQVLGLLSYKPSQDEKITHVCEKSFEVYPYDFSTTPSSCPLVYEMSDVDEEEREERWLPRIAMFDLAKQVNNLFTLSIIPVNPRERQSWYQKKMLKPCPEYFLPESSSTSKSVSVCTLPQDPSTPPTKQLGFLKPFDGYSSKEFGTDPRFESVNAIFLSSKEEIVSGLEEVSNVELKAHLVTILNHFMDDREAKSVGLVFRNGAQACTKLFHKIFE